MFLARMAIRSMPATGAVAEPGFSAAAPSVLSLGTDQPSSTLSDIGNPSAVIRFNTLHFTCASTLWFSKSRVASLAPNSVEPRHCVLRKTLPRRSTRGAPRIAPFLLDTTYYGVTLRPIRRWVLRGAQPGIAPRRNRRYRTSLEGGLVTRTAVVGTVT